MSETGSRTEMSMPTAEQQERFKWRANERADRAEAERDQLRKQLDDMVRRPCARYWGSDGTLCSTHHGRFADGTAARCDRRRPSSPPRRPMTDTRRLRELADEATPGPLRLRRYKHGGGRLSDEETDRRLVADFYGEGDREYYAAADPQTVLALLDVADAARALDTRPERPITDARAIARLRAALDHLDSHEKADGPPR